MFSKTLLLTKAVLLTLILTTNALAQDIGSLKRGVVRIKNNNTQDIGSGFIVKVVGTQVYIVTAAHVIRGTQHPGVYLFNKQYDALSADVLDMEEDDLKGLGLLRLELPAGLLNGITSLKLGPSSQLDGGEDVKVIGFPDGTEFWTVGSGNVARIQGRNLVFSGAIRGGNSGGPVISQGVVIGMITDVSQNLAYAARGEALVPYLNGVVPNLIGKIVDGGRSIGFCETLSQVLDESKNGFYGIVGTPTKSENTFSPKIMIPGAIVGYLRPPNEIYYYLLVDKQKGNVEGQFFAAVTKVQECSPNWEEKEVSDSTYRYHKFRRNEGGVVVAVYYNPVAQNDLHYLTLRVAVPDEPRREW
jgi:hypothetical protein